MLFEVWKQPKVLPSSGPPHSLSGPQRSMVWPWDWSQTWHTCRIHRHYTRMDPSHHSWWPWRKKETKGSGGWNMGTLCLNKWMKGKGWGMFGHNFSRRWAKIKLSRIISSQTNLHLWHWKTFSPQLAHTPGLAGTEALQRGHCSVSVEAWRLS